MYSPHNVEKYGSQNNTEPLVKKKNYNTESISMALKMWIIEISNGHPSKPVV